MSERFQVRFVLPHPRDYASAETWWRAYRGSLQLLWRCGWHLHSIFGSATRLIGRFDVTERPAQDVDPILLATPKDGDGGAWWPRSCLVLLGLEEAGWQLTGLQLLNGHVWGLVAAQAEKEKAA